MHLICRVDLCASFGAFSAIYPVVKYDASSWKGNHSTILYDGFGVIPHLFVKLFEPKQKETGFLTRYPVSNPS